MFVQCVEQKLTRQIEMIQVPINDLGCEQVIIIYSLTLFCFAFSDYSALFGTFQLF